MSEFMLIVPAPDQPLWKLKRELEELGGLRRQDFSPVPNRNGRYAYQVTPELYAKWQQANGVQRAPADTPAETSSPTADSPAAAEAEVQSTAADGGTEQASPAAPAAPEPAQGDTPKKGTKRNRADQQGKE